MRLFFLFLFLKIGLLLFSQETRSALEKKNMDLVKQINALELQLKKNKKESTTSLLYLKTLEQKLSKQTTLIVNIQKEKRLLDDEIYLKQREINKLSRELSQLREDFKKFLLFTYKKKSLQNKFLFMLSSKSIAEVYRRIHYLKILSEYQNRQSEKIRERIKAIKTITEQRKKSLLEKEILLEKERLYRENLTNEKLQQQEIYAGFESNKSRIIDEIKFKQKLQQEMKIRIEKAIQEEIRIAKEKAEAERKAREAELARLRAIEEERLRKEAEEEKKRLVIEQERKRLEEIERKRLEEERIKKENELKILREQAEEKRKQALLTEEESKRRRDIIAAENLARELEERRIAKEKELALIKEKENQKITEIKRLDALRKAEETKREELSESKSEAFKKATTSSVEVSSSNFSSLKGQLPPPVKGGVVVGKFGKTPHPLLQGILVNNNGIDIAASKDKIARAVFAGKVTAIYVVPGGNKAVLLQHGSYFTLYHNLKEIYVAKGEAVNQNQSIGMIYTDSDGNTILNFQVWKETTTENPEIWLRSFN